MPPFRPFETKCVERLLAAHGFKYNRTTSSHDIWTKPGHRSIPVWGDEKEIPAQHMKGNCRTIGITMEQAYEWAGNNC